MKIQTTAKQLTYLGILPFVIGIFIVSFNLQKTYAFLQYWEVAFGAVIASFIAGTHWAFCLSNNANPNTLIHSNIITLIAWCSLLTPHIIGINILIFSFLYLLMIEYRMTKNGILQQWYFKMRCIATSSVVSALIVYAIISITLK